MTNPTIADWQPIETAPPSGDFQVWLPGHELPVQSCRRYQNLVGRTIDVIGNRFVWDLAVLPTHWAPLPEGPKP